MQRERVVPGRLARPHEVVQPAEQAKRRVPVWVWADDLGCDRIACEAAAELYVERRPALAVDRLGLEDLGRRQASSAVFARSAIAANAAGSDTAKSASTLRSSSISAFFSPATNWL